MLVQNRWTALFVCIAFLSVLTFSACRQTYIATYNAGIAQQIGATAKMVDGFYLTLQETTSPANNGRSYDKFAPQYVAIELELNELLAKNKIKALNKNATAICDSAVKLWVKYKKAHKTENTIDDFDIALNRIYMRDMFFIMQTGEDAKKIADGTNKN
jgi:hypothetical protein